MGTDLTRGLRHFARASGAVRSCLHLPAAALSRAVGGASVRPMARGGLARRHRVLAAILLSLCCAQPGAALPLALLGQEIVRSIVRSLVEDAIHSSLIAALGPCDGALASGALTGAQALLDSRGPVPAMPALPTGMAAVPSALLSTPSVPGGQAVAGASSALGAVAGAGALGAGVGALPLGNLLGDLQAQMRKAAEEERQAVLRERRADQKKRGLTAEQVEAEDRQAAQEELRDAEQMVAMLRDSRPLSAAELDEFVDHYARFAKLSSDAPQCSPGSLRRVLAPTMVLPMAAAPIRMMLGSLRELDKEMAEARRTFAAMTPDDREDFVQQMAAQFEEWSDEEREGFAALVRADALGMPQAMRDELLKRLRP